VETATPITLKLPQKRMKRAKTLHLPHKRMKRKKMDKPLKQEHYLKKLLKKKQTL